MVADAAFCNHCGERLPARCRACGAQNPPGSGFCHACGSPIAAPSTGARRFSPPPSAPVPCPRCSKTNEPGFAYCYSCGLPLEEPPPRADAAASSYARFKPSRERFGDGGFYEGASVGEPGGFWIRLAAFLIDYVVCLAISISTYIFGYEFGVSGNVLSHWIDDIIIIILYHSIAWSLFSTTIGKRIFNLYVVKTDGSNIEFGRALTRAAAYFLSVLFFYVGFLLIAFRKDKRGLHDLICDTMVVRRR